VLALVNHLPPWKLHPVFSFHLADHRHLAAVRRPVRRQRILYNLSWRSPGNRHEPQRALAISDVAVFAAE
jgi:hypothetical protein